MRFTAERRRAFIRTIRQGLIEGVQAREKKRIAELGINVFAALMDMPDMPQLKEWAALINDLAQDWGLSALPRLQRSTEQARECA